MIVTHHSHSFSARFVFGSIVQWKEVKPILRGTTEIKIRPMTGREPLPRRDQAEGWLCILAGNWPCSLHPALHATDVHWAPSYGETNCGQFVFLLSIALAANTSSFPPGLVVPPLSLSVYLSLCLSLDFLPSLSRCLSPSVFYFILCYISSNAHIMLLLDSAHQR